MKVTALRCTDFRNMERVELFPCEQVNVIYGENAQGKTNLLEALWLFCESGSFRGAKGADYIRTGQSMARLELAFDNRERSQTAELAFRRQADGGRQAGLNGVKLERPSELAGVFSAVVFSPDHLWLVKQGPERRRALMDTALGQIYPKYRAVLERYGRIVRQRSRLLRDIRLNPSLLDTLQDWDRYLVRHGAWLIHMRARYLEKLSEHAVEIYDGISAGREKLTLRYRCDCVKPHARSDRAECERQLEEALVGSRQEDLRLGMTTVGPHRDDMLISIDGYEARARASQGQQRSCVLALKLAECAMLSASIGEEPVVLLDDVMSELDAVRKDWLLNSLKDRQVFITCCDREAFAAMKRGRIFHIRAGRLEQEEDTA